jgi:hypothetical protein
MLIEIASNQNRSLDYFFKLLKLIELTTTAAAAATTTTIS